MENDKSTCLYLFGKLYKKENKYEQALKYFEESIRYGSIESIYEYGKMLIKGKGCISDEEKKNSILQRSY